MFGKGDDCFDLYTGLPFLDLCFDVAGEQWNKRRLAVTIVRGTGASRGVVGRMDPIGRIAVEGVTMDRVENGTARIQESACRRAATIVAAMVGYACCKQL